MLVERRRWLELDQQVAVRKPMLQEKVEDLADNACTRWTMR
jgi:hypothetical protein